MKVVLVSCVSKKMRFSLCAMDLYTSPWFRKARKYAELIGDQWFILSAKYGLLHPAAVIERYDETLTQMSVTQRRQWSDRVFDELMQFVSSEEIVILAGSRYREFLVPRLKENGYIVDVPMAGLGMGQQLHWLNEQNRILKALPG